MHEAAAYTCALCHLSVLPRAMIADKGERIFGIPVALGRFLSLRLLHNFISDPEAVTRQRQPQMDIFTHASSPIGTPA